VSHHVILIIACAKIVRSQHERKRVDVKNVYDDDDEFQISPKRRTDRRRVRPSVFPSLRWSSDTDSTRRQHVQ